MPGRRAILIPARLQRAYRELLRRADECFRAFFGQAGIQKTCTARCTQCCHAIFGLFPLEALMLYTAFQDLEPFVKRAVIHRAEEGLKGLRLMSELDMVSNGLLKHQLERLKVRCPFLGDDGLCVIYAKRPITCRVYGMPTKINGSIKVCPISGLDQPEEARAFDLDMAYSMLYELSKELLIQNNIKDSTKAGLLITVPFLLMTPVDTFLRGG